MVAESAACRFHWSWGTARRNSSKALVYEINARIPLETTSKKKKDNFEHASILLHALMGDTCRVFLVRNNGAHKTIRASRTVANVTLMHHTLSRAVCSARSDLTHYEHQHFPHAASLKKSKTR